MVGPGFTNIYCSLVLLRSYIHLRNIDLSLQQIHDAEADLEIARLDLEKSRDKLAAVKLQLREQQAEAAQGRGLTLR